MKSGALAATARRRQTTAATPWPRSMAGRRSASSCTRTTSLALPLARRARGRALSRTWRSSLRLDGTALTCQRKQTSSTIRRAWLNGSGGTARACGKSTSASPSRSYVSDLRAGRTLSTRCGALAYGSTEIASKRTTRGTAWERMRCLRCGRSRHKSGASRGPTRDSIAPCFDSAYKRPSHWTEDGQRTFHIATIVPPAHRCDRPAVGRSACSSSAQ